jgi:glycosyltransferase involved in cell wall biosynthesis
MVMVMEQSTFISPAIYYEAEGYRTTGSKLMGRHSAGESFLRAVVQGTPPELPLRAYCRNQGAFQNFQADVGKHDRATAERAFQWIPRHQPQNLAQASVLYLPGPNLTSEAQRRLAIGQETAYSLCGITHTISSQGAMQSIRELLLAPIHGWDAVICTSTAVRDSLQVLLEAHLDYLKHRLGARYCEIPQFPVIPLGVHCQDFQFTPEEKQAARARLGIPDGQPVVLFVGRLVFHAKAHPLPLYLALHQAMGDQPVTLIECGWFPNEPVSKSYDQARQFAAPNVHSIVLDGRQAQQRRDAWAAADIFTSLSDNIQETFGLTPIEAMAAGLPCVVSDWDGYKDTVREGIDGFRIPTLMPSAGSGLDFARRHELEIDNYDFYVGQVSQTIAVDVSKAADAFRQLLHQPEQRRQMGEIAKQRAQQVFDWHQVYRQYQDLWQILQEKRQQGRPDRLLPRTGAILDPYQLFANYPSQPMLKLQFCLAPDSQLDQALAIRHLESVGFAPYVLPSLELLEQLWQALEQLQVCTVTELQAQLSIPQSTAERTLGWLAKYGLVTWTVLDNAGVAKES